MSNLSERLREYRKANRMSQAALAERVGTSGTHIAKIEAGTYVPRLEMLIAMADEFGITLDELVGRAPSNHAQAHREQLLTRMRMIEKLAARPLFTPGAKP